MRTTGDTIFIDGIILIFKSGSCIQWNISFRKMFVITKSVTGKKALIDLCGIESCISKEGFRIDQWMFVPAMPLWPQTVLPQRNLPLIWTPCWMNLGSLVRIDMEHRLIGTPFFYLYQISFEGIFWSAFCKMSGKAVNDVGKQATAGSKNAIIHVGHKVFFRFRKVFTNLLLFV